MDNEKPLNRFEKEKRVIELYLEGKTIRDIAEEVRMAFRDISQLIKKFTEETDENKKIQKKITIEALTLFKEGKEPIEVAISLELTCEQTEKIYQEYWRLSNLHILYTIYQELKEKISDFIAVYYKFKGENRSTEEIIHQIGILLDVAELENYKMRLEQKIENYENSYRGLI